MGLFVGTNLQFPTNEFADFKKVVMNAIPSLFIASECVFTIIALRTQTEKSSLFARLLHQYQSVTEVFCDIKTSINHKIKYLC